MFETCAAHLRIRIFHRAYDTRNASGDQGFAARSGPSGVITRFQVDVSGCSSRFLSCLSQSHNLGVIALVVFVESFAKNRAIFHDDAPHQRVGTSQSDGVTRQLKSVLHEMWIVWIHGLIE
jgi:hypothetical protein